jgi:hypothetical protein
MLNLSKIIIKKFLLFTFGKLFIFYQNPDPHRIRISIRLNLNPDTGTHMNKADPKHWVQAPVLFDDIPVPVALY